MSKEKFTPGEWTVHEVYHEFTNQYLYNIYWSEDREEVAERVYTKDDAYLMAASKKMYEKLKCLESDLCALQKQSNDEEIKDFIEDRISEINELLKEARGEI